MANAIGNITVRQGRQQTKVSAISYGQPMELHKAIDLSIVDPLQGEAIIYNASTNNFEVGPIEGIDIVNIFGGTF